MKKRIAEVSEGENAMLKDGERPRGNENDNSGNEFEDQFEDEFESEDEIIEAGVDGRPDKEREADESRGTWFTVEALCESAVSNMIASADPF